MDFRNIYLTGIKGVYTIYNININQKINEHGYLKVVIIVSEDEIENFQSTRMENRKITCEFKDEENEKTLFCGIIQKVFIEYESGLAYATIEAATGTYRMDIKKQNRSYQNKMASYDAVIRDAMKPYTKWDYIWPGNAKSKPVKRFILQFKETEWEFIKRVAAMENRGLIPEIAQDGSKFYIGLPEGREPKQLKKTRYKLKRNLREGLYQTENNKLENGYIGDFITCEVIESQDELELGEPALFLDEQWYVAGKETILHKQDGILKHNYILTTKDGTNQPKRYNKQLQGNSIIGTVIDIRRSETKLRLTIDQQQQISSAYWFPQPSYYTAGNDYGYTAMPERGDQLYLHFPTADERDCYIISGAGANFEHLYKKLKASSQNPVPPKVTITTEDGEMPIIPELSTNPRLAPTYANAHLTKHWTTPDDKSMLMDDSQIKFHSSAQKTVISLIEEVGVSIYSEGDINIIGENIYLNPYEIKPKDEDIAPEDIAAENADIAAEDIDEIIGEVVPADGKKVSVHGGKYVVLESKDSSLILNGGTSKIHAISNNISVLNPSPEPNDEAENDAESEEDAEPPKPLGVDDVLNLVDEAKKLSIPPLMLDDRALITGDNYKDKKVQKEIDDFFVNQIFDKYDGYRKPEIEKALIDFELHMDGISFGKKSTEDLQAFGAYLWKRDFYRDDKFTRTLETIMLGPFAPDPTTVGHVIRFAIFFIPYGGIFIMGENFLYDIVYFREGMEKRGLGMQLLVTAVDGAFFLVSVKGAFPKEATVKPVVAESTAEAAAKGAEEAALERTAKYTDSQIDDILKNIKGDGFKNNPLRQAYEKEVSDLAKLGDDLLAQGKSTEEIAKTLNQARRDLGIKYKDMTPQPLRDYIYEINQSRYKDPLGPKFEDLLESKTYEQIIDSSSRYNPDIDKLLSGFEKWLRGQ